MCLLASSAESALAQTTSARRMAMGGVSLGSESDNVAYRAVPRPRASSVSLPIGLVPVLQDPPSFDVDDPEFNAFEILELVHNPPWNLNLSGSMAPSNDIYVTARRGYLQVDLGDIKNVLPRQPRLLWGEQRLASPKFGHRGFFVGASAVGEFRNRIQLNDALLAALAEGEAFQTNTEYALFDDARGQAAAGLDLGWAALLAGKPSGPKSGGPILYGGLRASALRGLALGDARSAAMFVTQDTLLTSEPVAIDYTAEILEAGPAGGGFGHDLDLGFVATAGSLELGVGFNHVSSRLDWSARRRMAMKDSVTGDYVSQEVATDVPVQTELPGRITVTAARTGRSWTLAADVVRRQDGTLAHVGLERWLGPVAARGGVRYDEFDRFHYAGGLGARWRALGVDMAVGTHSRTLTGERAVELAAGFSLYR